MSGRTRFSKMFVIISEICSRWVLDFLKTRIPPSVSVYDFIHKRGNEDILNERIIADALEHKKKKGIQNDDFDITALDKIIKKRNLVKGHPSEKTIKDTITAIRLQRNDFMHTTEASLDENEYMELIKKFKKLAFTFELVNNKLNGEYIKQIEDIDTKIFDEKEVRNTIIHYNKWIMAVKKIEIPPLNVPGIHISLISNNATLKLRNIFTPKWS